MLFKVILYIEKKRILYIVSFLLSGEGLQSLQKPLAFKSTFKGVLNEFWN